VLTRNDDETYRVFCYYQTEQAALDALSRAATAFGRRAAGLPDLP
jgi:hypothetical protein